MSAGQLLRAEINTRPSALLYRAELDAVPYSDGVLIRAEMSASTVAAGQILRAELRAGLVAAGQILRAEMSSASVPVTSDPDNLTVEPGATAVLQGYGGNSSPVTQVWSLISGPAVTLTQSGARATYTAPKSATPVSYVFQYQVDGSYVTVRHTVLPTSERGSRNNVLVPQLPAR